MTESVMNVFSKFKTIRNIRVDFLKKTYLHLAGAIVAFIALECLFLQSPFAAYFTNLALGTSYSWLLVLGGFMLVSSLAERWAKNSTDIKWQYLGLGLYVVAEAIIFIPLLSIAWFYSSPDVIPTAGLLTLLVFAGITTVAFTTNKDFSFLRSFLILGSFIAFGLIICSAIFGFTLGLVFSGVMVVFASIAILYSTSNIIHHYDEEQYVAASLSLFASVALLFWYILQILIDRD